MPSFARASSQAPRSIVVLFSIISLFALGVLFSSTPAGRTTLGKAGWTPSDHSARFRVPPHREPRQQQTAGDKYLLGVGKADITGPVVEVGFAGYADLNQKGTGLRQRIHSRAFIVGDVNKPNDRFIYLLLDIAFGDTAIRRGILEGVQALGSNYAMYNAGNIAVTGTHSHSGPGAWFNYLLPQITTLGFDQQSYQAIVDGAVLSIKRAHESLQEGNLDFGTVNVEDSNISRSLYAYMANPAAERAQYSDSVDKEMTVLRFKRASDGKNIGILTWFPVHPTSVYQNSTHVTGDNKGVAELMFEKAMVGHSSAAEGFVAGFSQANVGDTTPNVLGAWCDDGSGQQCSYENSTCADGKSQACHGRGPMFQKQDKGIASCYEIGRRQYNGARSVYDKMTSSSGTPVVGSSVKSFHFFHDMKFWDFQLEDGTKVQTCPAALGYSFAAGTTDGPGAFDFTQGDSGSPSASPLWLVVKSLLRVPTAEQLKCQGKKPVLLDVGEQTAPYEWSANIVDMQMLRVGQFVIIVSPSEATTMAGRRWRNAVKTAAKSIISGNVEPKVVLGGPANTYAHYVTTPEEFDIQRYEGASTLYGKWELNAYINLTVSNIQYLASDASGSPPPGPEPQDNRKSSLDFITGVVYDGAPSGQPFGQVLTQPAASYARGAVVNATFVGANPRNNLRLEGTFLAVEKRSTEDGLWKRVRDDTDWSLVYYWTRTNGILGQSQVTASWETEADAEPGQYRLKYYGDSKNVLGGAIKAFEGTSNTFTLA